MELQEIITEIILGSPIKWAVKEIFHSFTVIIMETLIQKMQKFILKELVQVVCLLG